MGRLGKCCCECELCEQALALQTWEIVEPIAGYSFDGNFSVYDDVLCRYFGTTCFREVIEVDDQTVSSSWSDWYPPSRLDDFFGCKECIDCTDPNNPEPPPPCAEDLDGNIECGPGQPTYASFQTASRSAFRVLFFYQKFVWVIVEVVFVTATTVRFAATVTILAKSANTTSSHTQTKKRPAVVECVSNKVISTSTETDPGALAAPKPLKCPGDLIGNDSPYVPPGECPPLADVDPATPCVTGEPETETAICNVVVDGVCATVTRTEDWYPNEINQCCDASCFNTPSEPNDLQQIRHQFISAIYDCDSIPASIELLSGLSSTNISVGWNCAEEGFFETPSDIVLTMPGTLTLEVA